MSEIIIHKDEVSDIINCMYDNFDKFKVKTFHNSSNVFITSKKIIPYIQLFHYDESVDIIRNESFFDVSLIITYKPISDELKIIKNYPVLRENNYITIKHVSELCDEEGYFARNVVENVILDRNDIKKIFELISKVNELIEQYIYKKKHPIKYFIKNTYGIKMINQEFKNLISYQLKLSEKVSRRGHMMKTCTVQSSSVYVSYMMPNKYPVLSYDNVNNTFTILEIRINMCNHNDKYLIRYFNDKNSLCLYDDDYNKLFTINNFNSITDEETYFQECIMTDVALSLNDIKMLNNIRTNFSRNIEYFELKQKLGTFKYYIYRIVNFWRKKK